MRLVLPALIWGAVSVTAFSIRNPLAHHAPQQPFSKHKPHPVDPFQTFINHFDSHRVATDTYLQTHLSSLYPNRTMTTTQDPRFQLLSYAANDPHGKVLVRQMDDVEVLKRTLYVPNPRRRDGDGRVVDMVLFAGYEIAWGNQEFTAIVATWSESYYTVTQWHLFGPDESSAHALIQEVSAYTANIRNAVWVYDQSHWQPDYALWEAIQKASWDDVVLEDKLKKSIQNDYRSFFKSEDVYKRLNVPWKRGLIFLGPPGNGKTISLKAIMKEVKVPLLYVKTFHTYMGDEFGIRSVFAQARSYAPCVLILEDLDSLITDQNRAFFLNEVDGLEDNDGLLLIGSTNHFDRLDPALSSRPSRFDRKYNFPNPNKAERRDYAVYWQDKLKDNQELEFPDELLDKFAEGTDKFSFAYMKEVFVSTLLIIAGQEPGEEVHFGDLLMDQVKKIKKDIEDGEQFSSMDFLAAERINGGDDGSGEGGSGGYPPEEVGELRVAAVGVQVDAGQKVFGRKL